MNISFRDKFYFGFNWQAYSYPAGNDVLIRAWPWHRKHFAGVRSSNYQRFFESVEEYWMFLGKEQAKESLPQNKIKGYDTDEVIRGWIKTNVLSGYSVVLYDINVQNKPSNFWVAIPNPQRLELLKDVVVLRMNDYKQMVETCNSINRDFAKAIGVYLGNVIFQNEDFRKIDDE